MTDRRPRHPRVALEQLSPGWLARASGRRRRSSHLVAGGGEGGARMTTHAGDLAAYTDKGKGLKYSGNQDGYFVADGGGRTWLVVCDGVGGAGGGDLASRAVLEHMADAFDTGADLVDTIRAAPDALAAFARTLEPANNDISTTIVAAEVRGRDLCVAHAGDSPAILVHRGAIAFRSRDHTLPQLLADRGKLSQADVAFHPDRNLLTRSVRLQPDGTAWPLDPDVERTELERGDHLLLASDAYDLFVDTELLGHVRRGAPARIVRSMRRSLDCWVSADRVDDNATLIVYRQLRR